MTIDEAIRLKQLEGDEFLHADPDELDQADALSIEALKRTAFNRGTRMPHIDQLLPGETKD